MYGFKGIKQTFYFIVGLLVFLFGLSYTQLAGFVGKISKNAEEAQNAARIDLDIRRLGEQFWTLRFWEQAVQTHNYADADQQFGVTLERFRTQLETLNVNAPLAADITNISSLLTQYEESFNRLVQYRTEQRLNQTQIGSHYQVISSTVLQSQDLDLLKPLLNLNRFLARYLSTNKDSEYKALQMIFRFLRTKLIKTELMDERLQSYMERFEHFIELDFLLEKKIQQVNDEFANISQRLMTLFLGISDTVAALSRETVMQGERLQEQIRLQLILFSGIVFLALIAIIGLIGRKIINPIQQMSSVAMQVKAGNSKARFVSQERDEIAALGFAFNDMLDTIHQHHDRLEALVDERTEELIRANAQLQQEIVKHRQTERHLEKTKEAAEVANHAKSTFLANMSHELRTPLNAIIGFAQVMQRSRSLSVEQQANLRIIYESGDHLLTLINQVLDLSKVEAGRILLTPVNFDLYNLLTDLEDIFRLKAKAKGLELRLERSPELPRYIQSDEIRLRQVLLNLLSNAIKFTEQGTVTLKASCLQGAAETLPTLENTETGAPAIRRDENSILLYFEVKDTGPGIAPEEQAHLFEAFRQTKAGINMKGGTGLGLSISRKFIKLMEGEISVRSVPGRGSSFKFSIPVRIVSADSVEARKPERRVLGLCPGQEHFRILVVDDQAYNRQLLVKLLQPLRLQLHEAMNGAEALELWKAWQPHLIWMDMRMPVMDGYASTKNIRELEQNGGTRTIIIALTALSLSDEERKALQAGCDAFVRKPFREADVFELLHKHLGLQFIYEAPEEEAAGQKKLIELPIDSFENVKNVPEDLLARLKKATTIADIKEAFSIIQEIRAYHEPLANTLKHYIENYEYTKILHLIQTSESVKDGELLTEA